MQIKKSIVLFFVLLLLAGVSAACKSDPEMTTSTAPGIAIDLTDGICPGVVVQAGDQVTWTNQGKADHIIRHTPAEGASMFSSGTLIPGDSFTYSFMQPGEYTYSCSEDGSMSGKVTVNP
jgi:plastocyanin